MKKLFSLLILLHVVVIGYCQTKEGDAFLDVYYGFPDWQKYIMRNEYSAYNYENIKISSTGHMGLRGEYMVSRRIGFGLDLWYVKTTLTATRVDNIYNYSNYYSSILVGTDRYEVKESLGRIAVLGRFLVHIGNSKKVDPYIHAGFGYANYMYNYSAKSTVDKEADNFFPLAARAGFGLRIFLHEKFGANMDMGLGGPLFTLGLTYKISGTALATTE